MPEGSPEGFPSVTVPTPPPVTVPAGSPAGQIDDRDLPTVSVTGTLSPLTALQSARFVSVITSQQIQAAAVQTINDILKLAVGVDVRQRGGFGIQTDISIDGGTFDQITILLNGVNISSPHTGHLTADFPVILSDIERIEILEGAASRVYGASAFGGAINIVTKSPVTVPAYPLVTVPEGSPSVTVPAVSSAVPSHPLPAAAQLPTTIEAGLHAGSYGTFGADARLTLPPSPLRSSPHHTVGPLSLPPFLSFSAAYQRSDGATTNSDFNRGNVYLRSVYDAPEFSIDLQAGYSQKSYGANTFYSAAYPNQYERNTRIITSIGAETKGSLRLRPEVYWHRLYDNFQLIRSTTTGENFHRSDVHGARLTATLAWIAGRTTLGTEVREEGIYSTALGLPLSRSNLPAIHQPGIHFPSPSVTMPTSSVTMPTPSVTVPEGSPEGPTYTRHDSRTNLSFNLEHTILLPHFTLSAGLLVFHTSNNFKHSARPQGTLHTWRTINSQLIYSPGLDIAYRPTSHWRLFASYNKGFRLPTFTDLYYKSPTHEGNQGMRAEESHSVQLDIQNNYQLSTGTFQLRSKVFYNHGTNMIDWVMYSADDVFHSANFDLDNMGFSVQANCQLSPVNCQLSYAFIHQHRRDNIPIYKSNYAMEYLRHKVVATLDHPILTIPSHRSSLRQTSSHRRKASLTPQHQALTACWTLRWQDRMGSYILYRDAKSTGELVPYSPYATLDLKIRWTAPRYELWLEGTNLTNRRYYDLGNIPQPGLIILAGAHIQLP